jgi:hypothetical protein
MCIRIRVEIADINGKSDKERDMGSKGVASVR